MPRRRSHGPGRPGRRPAGARHLARYGRRIRRGIRRRARATRRRLGAGPDWLPEVERRMSRSDRPTVVTGTGRFYGGTAPRRWIARHIYIGGYFTVIGALLGHPPIYGSNYAMRADALAPAPRHRAPRPPRPARRPRPRLVAAAGHDRRARPGARGRRVGAAVRQPPRAPTSPADGVPHPGRGMAGLAAVRAPGRATHRRRPDLPAMLAEAVEADSDGEAPLPA